MVFPASAAKRRETTKELLSGLLARKNSHSVKLYGRPSALNMASLTQKAAHKPRAGLCIRLQCACSLFVNTNGRKSVPALSHFRKRATCSESIPQETTLRQALNVHVNHVVTVSHNFECEVDYLADGVCGLLHEVFTEGL